MGKERIIAGIEKVFESYAKDEEFKEALRKSRYTFTLFPKYLGERYLFNKDGETYLIDDNLGYVGIFPPRRAAENYFYYLRFSCRSPITLTKAKAMIEADLGKRVEDLKRDYARHFDNECDRQAENGFVQHHKA